MKLLKQVGACGALAGLIACSPSCKKDQEVKAAEKPAHHESASAFKALDRKDVAFGERINGLREELSTPGKIDSVDLSGLAHAAHPEGMSQEQWFVVVNEVMEAARSSPEANREECFGKLMGIYQDEECQAVIRDYAAQHLTLVVDQEPDPTEKERLRELAVAALSEACQKLDRQKDGPLFGTSLLSLAYLHESVDKDQALLKPDMNALGELVSSTIRDRGAASNAARSSSIQFAVKMNAQNALPAIRESVADEGEDLGVRLGSLHALGQFAKPEDKATLEKIAGGNTRLKFAAQQALKQYEKHL